MKNKTQIYSQEGKQELRIERLFDLPVNLLFKAYSEKDLFEQWMGTEAILFDCKEHGFYRIRTTQNGEVVFSANGTIHEFIPNKRITRTFEMENSNLPVQLEFLDFEEISDESSKLTMHIIFKSVEDKNQLMQLPFEFGLNMAHNRLQEIITNQNNRK